MRSLIATALLLIAASSSFAQNNEKKAQEAIRAFIKKEKDIKRHKEILFGPLEDNIEMVSSAEEMELKELTIRLQIDSLFATVEQEMGSKDKFEADPVKLKRYEELKKKTFDPPKKENRGYKMLYMCRIKTDDADWEYLVAVFHLDENLVVYDAQRLEY